MRLHHRVIPIILTLLCLSISVCQARVVYVKWDSPGVGEPATFDGMSWESAYHEIQQALDAASSGDEVWVAQGTYTQNIVLKAGVSLKGGYADSGVARDVIANTTTIGAVDQYPWDGVIGAEGAVLDGFTLPGRYNVDAVQCTDCSMEITNCSIGGVVNLSSSSSRVRNNTFTGRIASRYGSPVVADNTFTTSSTAISCTDAVSAAVTGNRITKAESGIYCSGTALLVRDNRVANCTSSGISAVLQGDSKIINNTATGCARYGISCSSTGEAVISGNVLTANKTGFYPIGNSGPVLGAYVRALNNTIVGNNIGVEASSGKVLSATLVNNIVAFNGIGVRAIVATLTTSHNDVYGNGRDYDGTIEHATDLNVDPQFASLANGELHIQPTSPCRDTGDYQVIAYVDTDMDGQARREGMYPDIGADESHGEANGVPARVRYVNAAADADGDGTSWATAYQAVQPAINALSSLGGGEVWVAKGTYTGDMIMKPSVHIYGGFTGTESVRDQRDIVANKTVIDKTAICSQTPVTGANFSTLDGFTILGRQQYGMYCSGVAPFITHNVFDSGYQGVWCEYGACPKISNNVITHITNYGVYCFGESSPTITSNTVVDNGGGIAFRDGRQYVANNIVAFGKCGGGIANFDKGTVELLNNNVYGNRDGYGQTADYGGGITPGPGDISMDPLFVNRLGGDLRLEPESPCVNAGANTASGICESDLDQRDRIFMSQIDIGAYEAFGDAVETPCIGPRAGGYTFPISVKITCPTDGATVRYTTNGMEPKADDPIVIDSVQIDGPCTLKARAWKPGLIASLVRSVEYQLADNLVAYLKKKTTNQAAGTTRATVSCVVNTSQFYIESDDRSCGIMVSKAFHKVTRGMRVQISGTIGMSGSEKCVNATSVTQNGTGSIEPLMVRNGDLGGGAWEYSPSTNAGQVGVKEFRMVKSGDVWVPVLFNADGMNNIGLYITTTGRVTNVTAPYVYIDDGSKLRDGLNVNAGYTGVRVLAANLIPSGVDLMGKYVKVTGISSCYRIGSSDVYRLVKATALEIME